MKRLRRLPLFVIAALALRAARGRADQVGPAHRLSGEQLPHREPAAVRRRRRQGDRRQAQDPAASERVAVQGARDQARRAGRPGAGRRDPARQLRERGPALRPRRRAVPRDVVRRVAEALQGVAQGARRQARQAGDDAALHGAVAAAGHLHQAHAERRRRHEGPQVARVQPGDVEDRRARRRAAGHRAGGRSVAGARHRRHRLVHVVGRDRLRLEDLRAHQELLRHAGVAAEERGHRQPARRSTRSTSRRSRRCSRPPPTPRRAAGSCPRKRTAGTSTS